MRTSFYTYISQLINYLFSALFGFIVDVLKKISEKEWPNPKLEKKLITCWEKDLLSQLLKVRMFSISLSVTASLSRCLIITLPRYSSSFVLMVPNIEIAENILKAF